MAAAGSELMMPQHGIGKTRFQVRRPIVTQQAAPTLLATDGAPQFAHVANLAILLPIEVPTLLRNYPTDQGRFPESAGWRVLVGGLWPGIMIRSALWLREPLRCSPVLLLQLIYKSLRLAVFALPLACRREAHVIPWGIAPSVIGIVLICPWLLP